jgi:SAM-dependent methyltransferase
MLGLDAWQSALLIILILICVSYLCQLIMDKLNAPVMTIDYDTLNEGFENASEGDAAKSKYEWLTGDEVFDDFYMQVHHKIFQHEKLVQAEAALALHDWKKKLQPKEMSILDVACRSGIASAYLASQNVGSVVGIDKSSAAIRHAKNVIIPATTLTPKQKEALELRVKDLYDPSVADQYEFTNCLMSYFSVYAFRDLDTLFRNLFYWTKPGGSLAIECVNRDKFYPIPDVANPWVGVNPQAYSDKRITKGEAVFDKFTYTSDFDLDEDSNRAEFKETFRFKDGTVRRQKQILYMPKMEEIVRKAQQAGWNYEKFSDLKMIGFDYGYMLFFNKP